ncbi:MAG: nucleotide 5'-monophosphate nucleosidase PpnN [Roseimicrobium sp.]
MLAARDPHSSPATTQAENIPHHLVGPGGTLEILSKLEVERLRDTSESGLHEIYRRCSLAVLNCGANEDNSKLILERYRDFDIRVLQQARGLELELHHAPAKAFVDGVMVKGIRDHLYSVLRDLVYTQFEVIENPSFDLTQSSGITSAVFHILRNAGSLVPGRGPNLVVCWGGHSISREEYDYAKVVGHELGLRGLDICTGCGPGAMKAPMKGAHLAHAKQRRTTSRYVGITEPGIIAAEPPNPIVNELVVMPDIEKRLEAFVRVAHAVIVFPGGVGTAEELLHLLGILLHPENEHNPLPLFLTGRPENEAYFRRLDAFIAATLGEAARSRYRIVIGDPASVARQVKAATAEVGTVREAKRDALYFNWLLKIEQEFQTPFAPSHANMAALRLHRDQPTHLLAAQLRRAFSGIVAGNVKEEGIRNIEAHGPFQIRGQKDIVDALDNLLTDFVAQGRMKLPGSHYEPCYQLAGAS